jgi:hypothetical protein
MIREAEAMMRKQRFLLCRYALIFVTGAVGFLATDGGSSIPIAVMVTVAIASNIFLGTVPAFNFFDASMQAPILITDTAMVSAILLVSRASQEFYLFFFFVLIMAAKIENLTVLAVAAALIGLVSAVFTDSGVGVDTGIGVISPLLLRIPFMLAAALFYGYVVLPERTGQMRPLPPLTARARAAEKKRETARTRAAA